MRQLYLVPNRSELKQLAELRRTYGAKWEYNDFFLPSVLDDRKAQLEIINTYAKEIGDFAGDTIHGAFLDVTLHSTDRLIREVSELRVRQSMDIAKEMGVRGVVFHTGRLYNFRDETYLNNWLNTNESFFRRMLEEYPDTEIYMENMFDESSDMMARLGERMKDADRFGLCLDYAHARVYGTEEATWFCELAPYVKHMHINDNDGRNDLHQAVGAGICGWQQFNQLMEEYEIHSSILVEVSGYEKQKCSLEFMEKNHVIPFD